MVLKVCPNSSAPKAVRWQKGQESGSRTEVEHCVSTHSLLFVDVLPDRDANVEFYTFISSGQKTACWAGDIHPFDQELLQH